MDTISAVVGEDGGEVVWKHGEGELGGEGVVEGERISHSVTHAFT